MSVKTIVVGDEAALLSALRAATGETRIQLRPGRYDRIDLNDLNPKSTITITSLDPSREAEIDILYIKNSSNLVFQDLYFHHVSPTNVVTGAQVRISKSHDLKFIGNEFAGGIDSLNTNDASGIMFTDSQRISVLDNEFHDLTFAAYALRSNHIVLAGNDVRKVREGFDFSDVDYATIDRNVFSNFQPVLKGPKVDHPDGIQFWTSGATGSTHVDITNNAFLFGNNMPIQGIFMRSERGNVARHSDILIENNVYQGQSRHGITVYDADGVRITGNTVVSAPKAGAALYYDPAINTKNTTDAEVDHNISAMMFSTADRDRTAHHNVDAWDLKTSVGVGYNDLFGGTPPRSANVDDFLVRPGSIADILDAGYEPVGRRVSRDADIDMLSVRLETLVDNGGPVYTIG